jgi:hypothetical protein
MSETAEGSASLLSLASAAARNLSGSRQHATLAWAALIEVWASRGGQGPLVTDARFRSIQLGWCE